jgi:putative restriction endonuclease
MRDRIEKYRRKSLGPHEEYTIGCILLQQPFFWEWAQWIPAPADFKKNVVQTKGYDRSVRIGRQTCQAIERRLPAVAAIGVGEPSSVYGDAVLVRLQYEDTRLWLPKQGAEQPNRQFREWHGDVVFSSQ